MQQVFLHGLGQTPESWTKIIAQFHSVGPRVQEIEGAGHEVNKDAPAKLCQALCDFYHQIR